MAKIRHIALTTKNPSEVAEFYVKAFDMQEIYRRANGAVYLSDGYINLTILNCKTENDADVGPLGPNFEGIHHIGFQVDDLENASDKIEVAKGKRIVARRERAMATGPELTTLGFQRPDVGNEIKWFGPNNVVIDISKGGWATSP
jgi:catechol 2,3-dioxygenase-like lactoylglutathione lyase family enzyme